MVMLDSNNTNINQPINLYKREKSFSILGDWLSRRKELRAKGYKDYYAFIQRTCGNRGYCFLKNETIAQELGSCVRTIQNYHTISQAKELITIIEAPHGRGNLFVLNYHPWMGIPEDQAKKLIPKLPETIASLICKVCTPGAQSLQTDMTQTIEKTQDPESLEISIRDHVEEIRGMHASEGSQPVNTTDSRIIEEKELATTDTNTTTISKNEVSKDNLSQETKLKPEVEPPPKSIYTLEIILKWVFEYAKMKLGTNDEIDCHMAIARTFLKTGEKDPWIAEFIKNNYVLSPVNPLKDYQLEQPGQAQQPKAKKISPKQARRIKEQTNDTTEVKGKYPYQVYLDFANYELKHKKGIESVDKFAGWLQRTGAQDDTQVAQFIELMKNTYIGGKPSQAQPQPTQSIENAQPQSTQKIEVARVEVVASKPKESSPLVAEAPPTEQPKTIEFLAERAWRDLAEKQKHYLFNQVKTNVIKQMPLMADLAEEVQKNYIYHQINQQLGKVCSKANGIKIDVILENIGKKSFESLEASEQTKLVNQKIDAKNRCFFELCDPIVRETLLEEMHKEIYLEMGLKEIAIIV